VFQTDQARELARRLEMLKVRTNRSYEVLSRRIGVSSSTLHRYCRGDVVPPTYDVVVRFCKVCGATREEAEDLLRCWSLATDRDRRSRPTPRRLVDGRWLAALLAVAGAVGGLVWRRRRR
jgi:transcriptional regulator with XRE-family HTH domain